VYGLTRIFGTGATGPVIVVAAIILGATALFGRRYREALEPA
jgi:hypothetical protein